MPESIVFFSAVLLSTIISHSAVHIYRAAAALSPERPAEAQKKPSMSVYTLYQNKFVLTTANLQNNIRNVKRRYFGAGGTK